MENIRAQWSKRIAVEAPMKGAEAALSSITPAPSFVLVDCPMNPALTHVGVFCIKDSIPWEVKGVNSLIEGARNIWVHTDLMALLKQAEQNLIYKEALLIPLFFRGKHMLVSHTVHQLDYNPLETLDFRNTVIR